MHDLQPLRYVGGRAGIKFSYRKTASGAEKVSWHRVTVSFEGADFTSSHTAPSDCLKYQQLWSNICSLFPPYQPFYLAFKQTGARSKRLETEESTIALRGFIALCNYPIFHVSLLLPMEMTNVSVPHTITSASS